jgi:subtilisin family serine protease
MRKRYGVVATLLAIALLAGVSKVETGGASTGDTTRYLVVLSGSYAVDGTYAVDSTYAVLCNYAVANGYAVGCNNTVAHDYAVSLVNAAGGTVANDMLGQIGVLAVDSANALFAQTMRAYAVVEEVGEDYVWQGVPATGPPGGGGGPVAHADPLEALQWDMAMIQAPAAHAVNAGWSKVDVGILDSGIDGNHVDFKDSNGNSNVDCARGRDFVPEGPGIGNPVPCIDNGFHGTHVAGIVAARANGVGVVGVAPNVTLVPVKVCDTPGYCYASAVVGGLTYAGDAQLDVINMSFFVDDDTLLSSTELKCMTDPVQRAFRRSVERAVQYARSQGVTPVAALGNSDTDLSNPPPPNGNQCDVVPAETAGVIGTMALGPQSEKADYSSFGNGATDVGAPGGTSMTGDCTQTVMSTFPGNTYGCISGTSMASPHTAGVAALIVSQFGKLGSDGDVKLSPSSVEARLQSSAVDIGLPGYDECFGHGRIDALRAVQKNTSKVYDAAAPFCPEYDE